MTAIRNMAELRALRARLASLPDVVAPIARRTADAFTKRAKASFDARTSASGTPWKPGKNGKPVTLHKSGTLEDKATRFTASGRRVRASVALVRYAKYQLKYGFLPRALPAAWAADVREIATDEISKHLRGRS